MRAHIVLFLVSVAPIVAQAAVYSGNPKLTLSAFHTVETLDGGSATVDRISLRHCDGGSWHDQTDVTIDPVQGATWDIPAGDWCAVDVYWSTDIVLEGSNGSGPFEIVSTDPGTRIDLDPEPGTAPLVPFTVEVGTVSSGHPRLQAFVD